MKLFYLLRNTDVNGNSGIGTVAEGVIFDEGGMCAMTWLSETITVTVFKNIIDVKKLHGHDGKTEVIIEGRKKDISKFEACKEQVRIKKTLRRHDEQKD
jgi:hypothetical protein